MSRIYIEKHISSNVVMRESYSDLGSAIRDFVDRGIGSTINIDSFKTYEELAQVLALVDAGYNFASEDMAIDRDSIKVFVTTDIDKCTLFPGVYKKSCLDVVHEYRECRICLVDDYTCAAEQTAGKDGILEEKELVVVIVVNEEKNNDQLLWFRTIPELGINVYAGR